jgi:hypothetical protein
MRWLDWLKGARREPADPRLVQWRQDWQAASAAPTLPQARALRERLGELGLDDERHEIEREMLEGLEALVELSSAVATAGVTPIVTGHRAVGHDRCYFSAPASLPDDPAQPGGTLLLTNTRAIFVGGSRSLNVPWHSVTRCLQQDRDVVLVRGDQDLHRLRCNSFADALRAAFLARTVAGRRI